MVITFPLMPNVMRDSPRIQISTNRFARGFGVFDGREKLAGLCLESGQHRFARDLIFRAEIGCRAIQANDLDGKIRRNLNVAIRDSLADQTPAANERKIKPPSRLSGSETAVDGFRFKCPAEMIIFVDSVNGARNLRRDET